ncbi:MAG: hypothetical protein RDU30_09935 [Desulfovibrionaceae bacterium]|nr:hypothetical protein [Desulfovibrionaceae bacterium]
MKLSIDKKTLAQSVGKVSRLRDMKMVARAHLSALKSCGWLMRAELRNHVEYGGDNWAPLHPLTAAFKRTKSGWKKREVPPSPLYWLGRFARYVAAPDASHVEIGFGKSNKGRAGTMDRSLNDLVRKHEKGRTVPVTAAIRRYWAQTKRFFLRNSTTVLKIPARPSIGPVFRKMRAKIPAHFQKKFTAAMHRYLTGGSKS